jgi:cytidine deaminase
LFTSSTKTVLPCAHCFQLIHKLPSRHRSVDRPSGIDIKLISAQR